MYERSIAISDVLSSYGRNHKIGDKKAILRAYEYAAEKHRGTFRGSGEPYIMHPLRVARFLADWGFESDAVSAALLHDVVEDCHVDLSEIGTLFGTGTMQIVDAVTALSGKDFPDHTLPKEKINLLSDARLQRKMSEKALYVKIADRIDNLSTLDGVPENKRIPKAEHTREIIIPMAMLHHAYAHAELLNDLCFEAEHSQMYQTIKARAEKICEENHRTCTKTLEMLKELFRPDRWPVTDKLEKVQRYLKEFRYEIRSSGSIFREISHEAENIQKDLASLVVKERIAFYDLTLVLSDRLMSESGNPQSFDVFFLCFDQVLSSRGMYLIGFGKTIYSGETYFLLSDEMDNLYRMFVRTEQEDKRYRYGDIIDSEGDFFIPDVNEIEPRDTYNEKIRVFRKDGSALLIEKGATVLDFAFSIHTDLGLHFDYAMIDESKTQLPAYTRLNEGDMITVVTDDSVTPNLTWFNYVRTRKAVHRLVSFFQGRITVEDNE